MSKDIALREIDLRDSQMDNRKSNAFAVGRGIMTEDSRLSNLIFTALLLQLVCVLLILVLTRLVYCLLPD